MKHRQNAETGYILFLNRRWQQKDWHHFKNKKSIANDSKSLS